MKLGNNLNINVTQACGITLVVKGFRKECLREKEKNRREKDRTIVSFFCVQLPCLLMCFSF